MREIKFRAWGPNSKYMWSWKELVSNDISMRWMQPSFGEKVLMQYTGLKDKTGKDIYEGDIIKVFDKYSEVWSTNGAEVIFSIDYVGGWVISNGKENLTLGKRQNSLRVIGNIHENPELLK